MSNIMLIDACNLGCPYCFANEFVNKDRNEITEENFDKALEFICKGKQNVQVGLIGGEPTIHSKFALFLKKLILDNRVGIIMIYTNGIALNQYFDLITHPKVRILVNLNPPSVITQKRFDQIVSNLDYIINQRMCKEQVTLGINMYGENFEYQYMIDLLQRYDYKHVRTSIVVPNLDEDRNKNALEYFKVMKPRVLKFYKELLDLGITPYYDCNKMPSCMLEDADIKSFESYLTQPELRDNILRSNISNKLVECKPVIDIRQDLTAVRCLGLSEYTKQDIKDYDNIDELAHYYTRTIDSYMYNTAYSKKCTDCHLMSTMQCTGGCLAFKIKDILELQKHSKEMMESKFNEED